MSASHPHGHNGDGLSPEEQRKLWDHIRALEVLNEQMDEVRLDIKSRKELAKGDGFDNNILQVILKRRKAGEGETNAADNLLRMYEEALREQGVLPLEQTRRPSAAPRRPLDEIAEDLHGEELPEMPERPDPEVRDAVKAMDDLCRSTGATATIMHDGEPIVTFGEPDYEQAKQLVIDHQRASMSWLQRHLRIGYNAAARLIERMERDGVVSRPNELGARTVLVPGQPAQPVASTGGIFDD